jgi:hypothetical protein
VRNARRQAAALHGLFDFQHGAARISVLRGRERRAKRRTLSKIERFAWQVLT